jgi:hypothetical protein
VWKNSTGEVNRVCLYKYVGVTVIHLIETRGKHLGIEHDTLLLIASKVYDISLKYRSDINDIAAILEFLYLVRSEFHDVYI